jgi:hypothetical protein
MAQADTSVVTNLRKAILNICSSPRGRGCRRFSDAIGHLPVNHEFEEGKEIYKTVADLLDERIFNSANTYFDNEAPFQLDDVLISGSFSEGMQKVNFKTKSISDVDFMLILKNIKVTEEDQQKGNLTVEENTPFVNLYFTDKDLIEMWADFLETKSNTGCERSIRLSPKKLKSRFRKNYVNCGSIFTPLVDEDVEEVDEGPSVAIASKPSGKMETNLSHVLHYSPTVAVDDFDFVLAIKCDGWPLCAQEWLTRPRCWPSQEIVQKINTVGFHIVCKSSCEGDFRLSYYNAETILIQSLSDLQHKTYRAFKAFVRHYKEKDEWNRNGKKTICSYHLKTVLLWYCEKSDPKDWNEENIVCHLLSLIDDLISALKERNLPMYFMPKYNLMEQMGDVSDVIEKITELRSSIDLITKAIIFEEPDILAWTNFIFNSTIPGLAQVAGKSSINEGNFNPNDFIQQFQTVLDSQEKFWIDTTGRVPSPRDDLQREGAEKSLRDLCVKYLEKFCESMNEDFKDDLLK